VNEEDGCAIIKTVPPIITISTDARTVVGVVAFEKTIIIVVVVDWEVGSSAREDVF
jgi:hypothetical protein